MMMAEEWSPIKYLIIQCRRQGKEKHFFFFLKDCCMHVLVKKEEWQILWQLMPAAEPMQVHYFSVRLNHFRRRIVSC